MSRDRLERCFELCAEPAWRMAVYLVGDAHEAFDVVQQAFMVAARKPDRLPHDDPWPWFRQVVINEARNVRRKRKPKPAAVEEHDMQDPAPDPSAQAAKSESHEELRRALGELPEHEQEALALTALQGMTHEQAADALGIPVKTLSSHVARGKERLKNKLGTRGETLLASLAAAPVLVPPGGWEGALASWKAAAFTSTVTGTTAGAAIATGAVMVKKSVMIAGMVVALGVGIGGGVLISPSDESPVTQEISPPPAASDKDVAAAREDGGPLAENNAAVEILQAKLDAAVTGEREARKEADETRAELTTVKGQRDAAKSEVTKLEAELEPFRAEANLRGPTFTFGKHGQIDGVKKSDWKELSAASMKVVRNLRTLREAQMKGEQPAREVMLDIQKYTEQMRTYEYETIGVLPSWAKHNGEFTHPISHTNLIASELKVADMPLSETQIAEIERLGLQWEADYAAAQETYTDTTPRAQKMTDEYLLKGAFVDAVWAVLTPEQLDHFVDEDWHHVAFTDLYCTTLMIIHTSPIIGGADISVIRGKLKDMLVKKYSIDEEGQTALEPLLDTWQSDVGSILDPVEQSSIRFYTYDQGAVAAQATAKLAKSIRDYVVLSEEARAALLDDYAIYIPRVVK